MKLLSEDIHIDPDTQIVSCISKTTIPIDIFDHERMYEKSYWQGGTHEDVTCIVHAKNKMPSMLGKDRSFAAPALVYNDRDFISSTVVIEPKGNEMQRLESVKIKSTSCDLSYARISCGIDTINIPRKART